MDLKDYIGSHGENLFAALIGKWCYDKLWFSPEFRGAKAETTDYVVNLIGSPAGLVMCYVQVKATSKGYSGTGVKKKLRVQIGKASVQKLKCFPGPTYVVGIDVKLAVGYLIPITKQTPDRTIKGIPCNSTIDCRLIRDLWQEVTDYWLRRDMLPLDSKFK